MAITLPRISLAHAEIRPSLDFVLPGLQSGSVGLLVGPTSIGKSYFALQAGFAIATGTHVAGGLWPAPKKGPVAIVFGEDSSEIMQERLYWLRHSENLNMKSIEQADALLSVHSGLGHDLRIMTRGKSGFETGPFLPELCEIAESRRLVILDPLAFMHDCEENDNGAATRVMQTLQSVCRKTGAAILVLHHTGKALDREDWSSARGASAFSTAARWQANLSPLTKKEQENIPEGESDNWAKLAVVKSNYSKAGAAAYLERQNGGMLKVNALPSRKTKNKNVSMPQTVTDPISGRYYAPPF